MKKVMLILILSALAITGKSFAQGTWKTIDGGRTWTDAHQNEKGTVDFKLAQGENKVKTPGGTVILTIDGTGRVTKAFYQDLLGRSTQLIPSKAGTNGAPNTECKYPLPDACFGTANKSIGLCICKPSDLSSGIYTLSYYRSKQIAQVKYNDF